MVVVVSSTSDARMSMSVSDGLKAGKGIGKYAYPFTIRECDESRMDGD